MKAQAARTADPSSSPLPAAAAAVLSPALSGYLDLWRLAAALLVFAHHASYSRWDGGWVAPLAGYGHEAVVVFFVLSGFVIAFVREAKDRTASDYAISRISRLVSVAWPALIVGLCMDAIGRAWAPAAYHDVNQPLGAALASMAFVNEFWIGGWHAGSNIPLWSLSFEAGYYLLFGLWAFAPQRALWLGAAVLLVGPKILLLMPAWLLGAWVYQAAKRPGSARLNWALALGGAAWALLWALGKIGNRYITWRIETRIGPDLWALAGHSSAFISDNLIALGFALHVLGVARLLRSRALPAGWAQRLNRASLATFPLYLFHYPALYFFTALSTVWFSKPVGLFIGLASLLFSLAMTGPCERLRQHLRGLLQRRCRFWALGLGRP